MSSSILFVDSRVDDYQQLLVGLSADVEVYVLNAEEDGVFQMAKILEGRQNLDSIQVISHGSTGTLSLGSTHLNNDNLARHKDTLEKIGASLSESGDILLYGCNVAQGDKGLHFVNRLAEITGADVAASDDLTGSLKGSDWSLEVNTGEINTTVISEPLSYLSTLAIKEGTAGDDALNGTNSDDTLDGKAGNDYLIGYGGSDTYIIRKEDGHDEINNYSTDGATDIIKFIDMLPSDINRAYYDPTNATTLMLDYGTNSQLKVVSYFYSDDYEIDKFQFSDGTVWTKSDINNKINQGTIGDDKLNGSSGDDVLDGKAGNDYLKGRDGSDTYIIRKEDGQDEIYNYTTDSGVDTVKFIDMVPNDIKSIYHDPENSTNLIMNYGVNSQLKVLSHFSNNFEIDKFQFSDGTIWTKSDIDSQILEQFPTQSVALYSTYLWGEIGKPIDITYSFTQSATGGETGFELYSAEQQLAVKTALSRYSDISGITFVETTDSDAIDLRFFRDDLTGHGSASGYAGYPSGGDVHIKSSITDFSVGTSGFSILLHEVGHALGLKHPFDSTARNSNTLSTQEDTDQYTVMSYTNYDGVGDNIIQSGNSYTWTSVQPTTPMIYDVQAIQYLYGKNIESHKGNDTYTFSNTETGFKTIWDADGNDTFNLSNQTRDATVSLVSGTFSSIGVKEIFNNGIELGSPTNNIAIAYGVTIENVIGGSGNDIMTGNNLSNEITGGLGNDTINGGEGNDTAIYIGNSNDYTIEKISAGLKITSNSTNNEGVDTLSNIEILRFTDKSIEISTLSNNLPTGSVTISGIIKQGETLTATNDLADADGLGGITYQWKAGILDIGTGETFKLTQAEVDKTITVTASYTDQLNTPESVVSSATEQVIKQQTSEKFLTGDDQNNTFDSTADSDIVYGKAGDDTVNYSTKLTDIQQVGVSDDLSVVVIKVSDTEVDYLDSIETISFAGINISPVDLAKVSQATPLFSVATTGELPFILPAIYTGTVEGLEYELLGQATGDIISGSSGNDFLNLLGGDDAVNAGAGNDVIDGGTGSNFLTGGAGQDTFFVDGRGGSTTWSTITDWEEGEQLSLWGWKKGTSTSSWVDSAGATGFEGATLHADLDANGVIDISVTWAGLTQDQIVTPTEFSDPQLLWFT